MTDIAADDLSRPLGAARRKPAARPSMPAKRLFAILAGMMIAVLIGQLYFARRNAAPNVAVAVIDRRVDRPAEAAEARAPADRPADRPIMSAQDMENASGVTVVRGGGAGAPESVVIQVAQPAKPKIAAPDRRLIERSRHGALPRVASDGTKPMNYYARPVPAGSIAGRPRIAILVGGLGVSQAATADAVAKLPEAVSFAFAPYGGDLERQAQRARAEGHEIFIQAPMEPFDYPDNDPGPHTLRAGVAEGDNIDRLHWIMSRIQGYVGVVNFMGGKFTAQDAALRPVMKEIGDRGLAVIDDGSSNRSQITSTGAAMKVPALRADVVVDAVMRADAIDRELAKLEKTAREKGFALGAASAMPVSIERIARWARALEAKGIVLVPVSNAVTSGAGPS